MPKIFIDDSGTDRQPPFCVLAGYVFNENGLGAFSDGWQAVLDEKPAVKYLKMSEAESFRGEFWGWSAEERSGKLLRFAEIIKRNVLGGIGSFVSNKAYTAIVEGCLPKTVDHPYWLCFQAIASVASEAYYDRARGEKIDLVFDTQGVGYERRAKFMHGQWNDILLSASEVFGNLSFQNDRLALPLQASDMLAWHMRRHADNAVLRRQEYRPVAEVLWSIPTLTRAWEPQEMADFVDFYNAWHPDSPVNNPELHEQARARRRQ